MSSPLREKQQYRGVANEDAAIVKAEAVDCDAYVATNSGGAVGDASGNVSWTRGEVQAPGPKDKWFGVAFLVHLLVMGILTAVYVPKFISLQEWSNGGSESSSIFDDGNRFLQNSPQEFPDETDDEEEMLEEIVDEIIEGLELMESMTDDVDFLESSTTDDYFSPVQDDVVLQIKEEFDDAYETEYQDLSPNIAAEQFDDAYDDKHEIDDVIFPNPSYNHEKYKGSQEVPDTYDTSTTLNKVALVALVCFTSSLLFPAGALVLMIRNPRTLIFSSIIFSIVFFGLLAVLDFFLGDAQGAYYYFFFCLIHIVVAIFLRKRIPYAAAVLRTAGTAVRTNMGLVIMAYGFTLLVVAWVVWSGLTIAAVSAEAFNNDDGDDSNPVSGIVYFFLFVSFNWTLGVIMNCLHVTVSGTVGTFWFSPSEASSWWSPAIRDTLARTMTDSFGSVCLGSLLVAIIAALKNIMHRSRRRSPILACLIQCILSFIMHIIEYFNRWAFVYVALYGYGFLDAGRNVMTLFKSRGWTSVTSDSLIMSCGRTINLSVGLIGGLFTGIASCMVFGNTQSLTFLIGFLVGWVAGILASSILMGVVFSAAETVIVCFAEAPREFEENHPELSQEMQEAWRECWTGRLAARGVPDESIRDLELT